MRTIESAEIRELVERLCISANYDIPDDIVCAMRAAAAAEETPLAVTVLETLVKNAEAAAAERTAACQDTGMAVVFVEVGQDVHITGDLTEAINGGVRSGYRNGYLRCSVVRDPIGRVNTGDNTPAVIHYGLVPGDRVKVTVAPKGFGSENMGGIKMLRPSDGIGGVTSFIAETVRNAGTNACPPMIVGAGVGGTMELAALLAKKALLRPVGAGNRDEYWNGIEMRLLSEINGLGIGPGGFGGRTTALAVNIETFPTHIAGLPVAVCIGCHATRHAEGVI